MKHALLEPNPIQRKMKRKPDLRFKKKISDLFMYRKKREAYLTSNPICKTCNHMTATQIFHCKGKEGKMLLDSRYWKPVCRECDWQLRLDRKAA